MMRSVYVAAIAAGTLLLAPAMASALEGCTCATMAAHGTKTLGTLDAVTGAVTVNGQPALVGMELASGYRMSTGEDGSASMTIGSCGMDLGANSAADISMTGPDVCVKVLKEGQLVLDLSETEGASTQGGNRPFSVSSPNIASSGLPGGGFGGGGGGFGGGGGGNNGSLAGLLGAAGFAGLGALADELNDDGDSCGVSC